jgi:two-component system sensor histidine kinase EvgS
MRILIVDNNSDQLGLLERTVIFLGFSADLAKDGTEAIQRHIQQRHDLILLSLDLVDYDGYSTAQAIRQLERTDSGYHPSLICGLTPVCDGGIRLHCMQSGMDNCMLKPTTSREAIDMLVALRMDSGRRRRKKVVLHK